MKKLIIWGSSGHAKVLNEFVQIEGYEIIALVDNNPQAVSAIEHVPLFIGATSLENWLTKNSFSDDLYGAVAIGGEHGKDRLNIQKLFFEMNIKPINLLHPSSYIAKDAKLGKGVQILAHATVGTGTEVGNGVIVNTSASIDHECVIQNGVHIGPGAILAGCVEIGECSFIGTGAVVLPRIKIGKNVIVGAGSVVTRDIPDRMTVIGNPARKYIK